MMFRYLCYWLILHNIELAWYFLEIYILLSSLAVISLLSTKPNNMYVPPLLFSEPQHNVYSPKYEVCSVHYGFENNKCVLILSCKTTDYLSQCPLYRIILYVKHVYLLPSILVRCFMKNKDWYWYIRSMYNKLIYIISNILFDL